LPCYALQELGWRTWRGGKSVALSRDPKFRKVMMQEDETSNPSNKALFVAKEGPRGLSHFVSFSFKKRIHTLISVTEFTYINRHKKNKIKAV
jgi:hypothetical protein